MCFEMGENIICRFFAGEDRVGVVIDGVPAGVYLDIYAIKTFMERRFLCRARGFGAESDGNGGVVEVLSGLKDDVTCGAPLSVVISGETALSPALPPLLAAVCFAGGVAMAVLAKSGISVGAHIAAIGEVQDRPFDPVAVGDDDLKDPGRYRFPVRSIGVGETMSALMDLAAKKRQPLGGTVEGGAVGIPVGIGEPLFAGVENVLAKNLFLLPGVTAVGFGSGFRAGEMVGSDHNDAFLMVDGQVRTATNNAGGILGGISNGMPLLVTVSVAPPPLDDDDDDEEPPLICAVPGLVPAVESVIALSLLDLAGADIVGSTLTRS